MQPANMSGAPPSKTKRIEYLALRQFAIDSSIINATLDIEYPMDNNGSTHTSSMVYEAGRVIPEQFEMRFHNDSNENPTRKYRPMRLAGEKMPWREKNATSLFVSLST